MSKLADELPEHQMLLDMEVNRIVKKGSLMAGLFAFSGVPPMTILHITGIMPNQTAPILWASYAGVLSLIVWWLARGERIKGRFGAAVLIFYTTIPGMLFLISHFIVPSGAVTYINGPPVLVFVFLIILSGFTFNAKIPTVNGLLAGIQYFFFFMLDREHLALLSGPDPLILGDLTAPPMYVFKSLGLFLVGFFVGILGNFAHDLFTRVLIQEKERAQVSRLFGQFVSEEVKEKIVADRTGSLGAKKKVVILFADLRGFSRFSEETAPEEIVSRLNEYFDTMVRAITEHGGVVDKFIGDAVMAVFGGVLELEHPCDAAQQAALGMRRGLEELNRKRKNEYDEPLNNGIGLHFGEVLQGTIGSRDRKDFTVIGNNVNIASRLEGICKKLNANIVVSQEFYDGLTPAAREKCASLGRVRLKGKQEDLEVYAVRETPAHE